MLFLCIHVQVGLVVLIVLGLLLTCVLDMGCSFISAKPVRPLRQIALTPVKSVK